ncbi:MAG TPA: hypothetical protein VG015_05285, partial [Candidatus Dormibacteraeota bacterium]|nr:hypothetical protein [Candidatus Dormibacteraeota bacterium]
GGGGPVTGTDHVLRLDSSVLIAQGVQDGDMLVAAEGDGSTIGVRCGAAGCITYAVANTAGGHAEGHITFTLTGHCQTPATMPAGSGGGQQSTFYFAEGFTGPGFTECLVMFSPGTSGPARIDFFTTGGGTSSVYVWLFAGQVETLDVNGAVGWYQDVSAKVTLPGPGVVERVMNFQFGQWHGSSDVAGAPTPTAEWDFAEGSTLSAFDEFLTLENPNSTSTPVQLAYFLDNGGHPIKTLTIPAQSRTTIEVFSGSGADSTNCVPRGVGASCGIGRGIGGVGVSVTAGASIIAERPMYVDGHDFGSGPINDGDVAFGANGPGNSWDFAEGTTLGGFNEYLTLADPSSADANVTMTFQDQSGNQTVRNVVVPASQRRTVQVFDPVQGVGPGVPGVSVQVTSNVGIVSERPEYVYHDFGSGPVAGADVVVGARVAAKLFDFAGATTRTGENDYLTVLNPGASAANLTITYYLTGSPSVKTMPVAAGSRLTIQVFDPTQGVGTGVGLLGVTVSSDQPVLVEKPTYSSSPSTYGATDTLGN